MLAVQHFGEHLAQCILDLLFLERSDQVVCKSALVLYDYISELVDLVPELVDLVCDLGLQSFLDSVNSLFDFAHSLANDDPSAYCLRGA